MNLRALRERAGLTQEALAVRLKMKKPAPISLWENGDQVPQPRTITKLAAALECNASDLLVGVVTPYDALRGSTEVVGELGDLRLTEGEKQFVRLWRKVPPAKRPFLEELIQAVARYARRGARTGEPPPPHGGTAERSPAADRAAGRARRPGKTGS